jgi:hypothetical protein
MCLLDPTMSLQSLQSEKMRRLATVVACSPYRGGILGKAAYAWARRPMRSEDGALGNFVEGMRHTINSARDECSPRAIPGQLALLYGRDKQPFKPGTFDGVLTSDTQATILLSEDDDLVNSRHTLDVVTRLLDEYNVKTDTYVVPNAAHADPAAAASFLGKISKRGLTYSL